MSRYAFRHVAPNPPPWGPLVFVGSLILVAISRSVIGFVIFAPVCLAGLYFWWRPPRFDFWVQLDAEGIVVRLLRPIRIPYRDISAVEPRRYPKSPTVRRLSNAIMSFGNFFGATWDLEGEPGLVDPYGVIVRFRRRIWVLFPLPPFLMPRKRWLFLVEDGAALVRDLQSRLGAVAPSSF